MRSRRAGWRSAEHSRRRRSPARRRCPSLALAPAWFKADNARRLEQARLAVDLLEPLAPDRSWRWPTATWRSCGCSPTTSRRRSPWGERAVELAERLGETGDPGPCAQQRRHGRGRQRPSRAASRSSSTASSSRCGAGSRSTWRARTRTSRAQRLSTARLRLGDRHLEAGITYCDERDLDSWVLYMTGWRARSLLDQGRWDAGRRAPRGPPASRAGRADPDHPAIVLGRLRARRGDPDPWGPLDEALELALEPERCSASRPWPRRARRRAGSAAEPERVREETDGALALARTTATPGSGGELYPWRRHAGIDEQLACRRSPSRSGSS